MPRNNSGGLFPAGNHMFNVNNRNTKARREICLKLTIKTPERRRGRRYGVFIVYFEHISHLVLVFLLLTLSEWIISIGKWFVIWLDQWRVKGTVYFSGDFTRTRNSHQKWSIKKVVLKSFAIFTRKHLC